VGVGSGTPGEIAAAERISRLREERAMLEEARDALRRGDAAGALQKLEQARARFPGGVLGQEREALAIEALFRGGQRAAASARGAAFLRAYPLSPHATRIQSFVQ
jgi:outer membrane protein assembly factor BamD (BamD/ComL family)